MALIMSPIVYDLSPPEGPKIVRFTAQWGASSALLSNPNVNGNSFLGSSTYTINLQQQAQTGQFSSCQSVWIDNSTCPLQVQLTELETGQIIFAAPFSQGFYPVFASSNPNFSARAIALPVQDSVPLANMFFYGTTKFFFMNVPCTPYNQLYDFTFNTTFVNYIGFFTTLAGSAFIQPALAITIPNPTGSPPANYNFNFNDLSNYAIVLQGLNVSAANDGPATLSGPLSYILYSAPQKNLGSLSATDGFYQDVLAPDDSATAISWSSGPGYRAFEPPIIMQPGFSMFIGPNGTAPAGNVLQFNANINYSFVQIA